MLEYSGSVKVGVYAIEHTLSGRVYIGSTVAAAKRLRKHRNDLLKGVHHSTYLQRVFNKYGESSLRFYFLIATSPETVRMYEQRCLDVLKPKFNMSTSAISPVKIGQKLPAAWVEKITASVKKRYSTGFKVVHTPRTAAYREKVAATSKSKWTEHEYRENVASAIRAAMTVEECAKKSERVKALWATDAYRAKAVAARKGNAFCKGYKCTPEQVLNRKRAARISNMKRNYGTAWQQEYLRRYPEHAGDLNG
jgi:group I intron endonuclease